MRKLLLLATLCMVATLMLAPAALAQPSEVFTCADFATQEDAQALLDDEQAGPVRAGLVDLDADGDGVACEEFNYGAQDEQYAAGAQYEQYAAPETGTVLPETGGPALLPLAAALVASGALGLSIAKRRRG